MYNEQTNINNSVFTPEELETLNETEMYRKKIVYHAFKDNNVPDSAKDIEAINAVLAGIDKNIHDKANVRLKHQDSKNNEAIIESVVYALRNIGKQKEASIDPNRLTEVGDEYIPLDTVPGETDINPAKIELEDIMRDREEDNG